MAQLTIRNIGPIKEVDIALNQVNVIIGPQSSGKSTINKIACYCTWVEKKVALDQSFDYFLTGTHFLDSLLEFHKMKGYFQPGSYLAYESDVIRFTYTYAEGALPQFEWVNQYAYQRTKISYIPAERNVVSLITGWEEVKLPNNNIFNFMMDWNVARKLYTPSHSLPIDYIESDYYYDEEVGSDFLQMANGEKILLTNASSGQQSMIPLYLLVRYFTHSIYEKKENRTVKDKEREAQLLHQLFVHLIQRSDDVSPIPVNEKEEPSSFEQYLAALGTTTSPEKRNALLKQLAEQLSNFIDTKYSSLFVEEPELNLFPSTQCSLLYYMLQSIQSGTHQLFITTHSPYVLYALNNCMMGALVEDKMPPEMAKQLACWQARISPEKVSAWQIADGRLVSIQEPNSRTIGSHYFNQNMNEVLNDYYAMLNFYTPGA